MRTSGTTKLLVVLGAAASAGHVAYPVALAALVRLRRSSSPPAPSVLAARDWPGVTVVIPAYREVGTMAAKIDDVRANGYPGPLEIIVVSEDPETATAARTAGVTVVEPTERLGKSQALNAGVAAATTPVVVLTDANNSFVPGSLAALVAHFDDPSVGAVAGAKTEADQGEAIYWRFESWLKARESELGTTLGIVGEIVAIRRELWRPIPVDIGTDDLWTALDLADRGHSVRYEPAARSVEPSFTAAEQWERRTRSGAGILHVVRRKAHLLDPRRGLIALEIVGHKLWRSSVGPLAHVALVAVSLASVRRSALARVIIVVHLVGAAAAAAGRGGRPLPRPLALLRQVLYLQCVGLGGLVRFLRRGIAPVWEKQAR